MAGVDQDEKKTKEVLQKNEDSDENSQEEAASKVLSDSDGGDGRIEKEQKGDPSSLVTPTNRGTIEVVMKPKADKSFRKPVPWSKMELKNPVFPKSSGTKTIPQLRAQISQASSKSDDKRPVFSGVSSKVGSFRTKTGLGAGKVSPLIKPQQQGRIPATSSAPDRTGTSGLSGKSQPAKQDSTWKSQSFTETSSTSEVTKKRTSFSGNLQLQPCKGKPPPYKKSPASILKPQSKGSGIPKSPRMIGTTKTQVVRDQSPVSTTTESQSSNILQPSKRLSSDPSTHHLTASESFRDDATSTCISDDKSPDKDPKIIPPSFEEAQELFRIFSDPLPEWRSCLVLFVMTSMNFWKYISKNHTRLTSYNLGTLVMLASQPMAGAFRQAHPILALSPIVRILQKILLQTISRWVTGSYMDLEIQDITLEMYAMALDNANFHDDYVRRMLYYLLPFITESSKDSPAPKCYTETAISAQVSESSAGVDSMSTDQPLEDIYNITASSTASSPSSSLTNITPILAGSGEDTASDASVFGSSTLTESSQEQIRPTVLELNQSGAESSRYTTYSLESPPPPKPTQRHGSLPETHTTSSVLPRVCSSASAEHIVPHTPKEDILAKLDHSTLMPPRPTTEFRSPPSQPSQDVRTLPGTISPGGTHSLPVPQTPALLSPQPSTSGTNTSTRNSTRSSPTSHMSTTPSPAQKADACSGKQSIPTYDPPLSPSAESGTESPPPQPSQQPESQLSSPEKQPRDMEALEGLAAQMLRITLAEDTSVGDDPLVDQGTPQESTTEEPRNQAELEAVGSLDLVESIEEDSNAVRQACEDDTVAVEEPSTSDPTTDTS